MTHRHWLILLVLVGAEMVSALEYAMIMAGLPAWLRIYADPAKIGWLVTAYLLVSASSAALCGRLGDLYGRKRVVIGMLSAAFIGSAISATAPSLGWVIAGRALQGVTGGVVALCFGLAREHLPPLRLPFAIGCIVATATGGAAVGLVIGGVLTDHFGPQSIFWASAIAALIALAGVILVLPRSTPSSAEVKLDLLGGVLMVPAIGLLLLALSNVTRWPPTNTLACAGLGLALLLFWIRHELRVSAPLIDLRLLGRPLFAMTNLFTGASALGVAQLTTVCSLLLQQPEWTGVGLGTSATLVGLLKFPGMLAGIAASIWSGAVSARRGGQFPVLIGSVIVVMVLSFAIFYHHTIAIVVLVIVTANLGGVMIFAGGSGLVVIASPPDRTAEAAGLMVVTRAIFQGIGAQTIAALLATSTIRSPAGAVFPDDWAYQLAFGFMVMAGLAGLLVALGLSRVLARRPSPLPDIREVTP